MYDEYEDVFVPISFYSHFKSLNLERKNKSKLNLWQYYVQNEGWVHDDVNIVIDLLLSLRFFNRFDHIVLRNMLAKVTLITVKKGKCVFLYENEAAIIVSGSIH